MAAAFGDEINEIDVFQFDLRHRSPRRQ